MIVIWNKRGLKLKVFEVVERYGETWFVVCKENAPNPQMGLFRVRAAETSAIDLLEQV